MIYPSLFFSSPPLRNGFSSLGVDLQGISCCSAHCGPVRLRESLNVWVSIMLSSLCLTLQSAVIWWFIKKKLN